MNKMRGAKKAKEEIIKNFNLAIAPRIEQKRESEDAIQRHFRQIPLTFIEPNYIYSINFHISGNQIRTYSSYLLMHNTFKRLCQM